MKNCRNLLLFMSPQKGSNGLGTLLTVTGTGFTSENASVFVGNAKCHVEQITSEWKEFNKEQLTTIANVFIMLRKDFLLTCFKWISTQIPLRCADWAVPVLVPTLWGSASLLWVIHITQMEMSSISPTSSILPLSLHPLEAQQVRCHWSRIRAARILIH